MKIWVDADACPKVIKEILFRVANRLEVEVILVANQALATPPSAYIKSIQVTKGFDVADNYIVSQTRPEDLIITADIPLAAEIVEKGAHALNPRGELYDQNNIKERLTLRDAMDELRSSGLMSGGPAAFSHKDRQSFSNALDRFLAKVKKPTTYKKIDYQLSIKESLKDDFYFIFNCRRNSWYLIRLTRHRRWFNHGAFTDHHSALLSHSC
ncbi:hypothetical protein A0O36_01915 [Piscirickettsiaceae bacterium NZ-RLO1]|nr:hypothetical protein A0O36_01915 [Piscirickettsiaceae bacterium NZ-RLO1]